MWIIPSGIDIGVVLDGLWETTTMKSLLLSLFFVAVSLNVLMSAEIPVYIVSNASDNAEPLLYCKLDTESADLTKVESYGGVARPSYLCQSPDGSFLYSTVEQREGQIAAWQVDRQTGKLTLIGSAETGGAGPCYLSSSLDGGSLFVANYGSGQLSVLSIAEGHPESVSQLIQLEGSGPDEKRQRSSHMHFIRPVPQSDLVLATDLGGDKIMIYRYQDSGKRLAPNAPDSEFSVSPGSGPRHLTFHPNGSCLYLLNELSGTVDAIGIEVATGELTAIGSYTLLPKGFTGKNTSAAIRVHPSGKFVYGSNRGDLDSITVFKVQNDGRLAFVELQSDKIAWPRDFNIDPSGKFLLVANRLADEVRVFAIDQESGKLTDTGKSIAMEKPVCVLFGDVF